MNIWGYTDNWYYYQFQGPKDEQYNISIYNSDDLKEIFNKDYDVDLRYVKITDFYFKKCYDDFSIFYYNEKEKSINFITNITDKIYKYFNILSTGEKQISSNEQSFYLKDDMLCIFNGCFLFIIDLSSKNAIKKIEMKTNDNEEIIIKNLSLLKRNGKEYLYITINTFNNVKYEGKTKILNGIIL